MTQNRINIMEPEIPVLQPTGPEEKKPTVTYASVSERFVALLIDYGLVFIPCQLIANLIFRKIGLDNIELWHLFAVLGSMNLVFILYETIFSCGDRVTLGKGLLGIAVVKTDLSGPISFFRALLRAIGYYISAALFMCGFLLAFFDDRRRALQDFFGGSVVVQIRQKDAWERGLVRILGSVLLLAFVWSCYSQFFGGGQILDQYYVRHARQHLKKIALLEEGHYTRYGYYTSDLLRLSLLSGDPVQFQRDTRKILEPKGFRIGVSKKDGKHYKISAVAKDKKHTRVALESGAFPED